MSRAIGELTINVRQKHGSMEPGSDFGQRFDVLQTEYQVVDGDLSETKTSLGDAEPDMAVSVEAFCASALGAVKTKESID